MADKPFQTGCAAPVPENEAARVAALRQLDILDTPGENAFDKLTRFAAQICRTPIALVTFIDAVRQWFKSRVGFDVAETPRDVAFCAHAIAQTELLIVPDTHTDPRFANNPLVTGEPHIRFYAAAPLRTSEGHALGTLCVMDQVARQLSDEQQTALRILARQVMTQLELRRTLAIQRATEKELRRLNEGMQAQYREGTARLQATEEPFKLLVESVQDYAIFMLDLEGRVSSWNIGAERIKGYTAQEIIGQHFSRFYRPEDIAAGKPAKFLRRAEIDGHVEDEGWRVRKDGTRFWANAIITSLRDHDGRLRGFAKVTRDMTERRRAEDESLRINAELEQRVAERTRQLDVINQELRGKNDDLKTFAYTVSHDLKAPLRGISGYAQELERRHSEGLGERARFCVRQIITASGRLDQLIEDVLRYSRLEREHPTLTEVRVRELIENLLHDRQRVISERGIQVRAELPFARMRTWERGLTQMLANLIDNAIKYNRDAQLPRIDISGEESLHAYRISVRDNGIGFDMKYHDRLFELFHRLVRQEEFAGTGAGLAIVKKIAEKQGGRVWAESQPGQGATFHLELPK